MTLRSAGISYSKHRNAIGLTGIIVVNKKARVQLVREWPRAKYKNIAHEIAALYQRYKIELIHIDILCGQYLINDLQKLHNIPLQVITTQKDMKDPEKIEDLIVMDKIEMTNFVVLLKNNHQIIWPKNPPASVQALEAQWALYTEYKTEAGGVDYYAPGDEFDNLTKSLMVALMARRKELQQGQGTIAYAGPIEVQHNDPAIELENIMDDYKI